MSETRISRLIVASLHQAIADVLPQRLDLYENWLNAHGLREGTIGMAPLLAVISFLRTEGRFYAPVMARAGEYAADWSLASMSPLRRRLMLMLPLWWRARAAMAVSREVVRQSYSGSKAVTRIRKGVATVDLRGSLFCNVRETAAAPLCGYYAAVIERVLKLFQVPATAVTSSCRASGGGRCELTVELYGRRDETIRASPLS
jgi:bacteriochlorophyll 4-vinyl reductase